MAQFSQGGTIDIVVGRGVEVPRHSRKMETIINITIYIDDTRKL